MFTLHLASQGTEQKLTVHDTPEYNGVSECLNQTLLERTRALLHSCKLPKNLWGETIAHVVWLKNRTTTHALPDGKTPYEMLYGRKPDLRYLHEWGSDVWVHTMGGTKLDGQSKVGKWVGFDEVSNGHRIYWPDKHSVTVEQSIKPTNGNMIILSIQVVEPIQGEKEPRNLQNNSEISKLNDESQEHTKSQQILEIPTEETKNTSMNPDQWKCAPFNQTTDELVTAQSCQIRIPGRYVRDIQNGIGTVDGRPGRNNLPQGI